jgi:penicillin-binding protein 1A
VLEPRVAYQMDSLLRDVIRAGTGRRARSLGRSDLAGKTGTTNDVRDAWFCGYQQTLVTVAWMGFDDFSPLGRGETGGESALGLWMDFMGPALAGVPEAELPVPDGMVQVHVDGRSGELVARDTPGAVPEWVREEYAHLVSGPVPVGPPNLPEATVVNPPSIIEYVY